MNNKHLTFEERSIIEDLLNKGEKIHKIAKKLGRPDSSIVREVLRNSLVFLQAGNNTQLIMTIAVNMSLQGLSIINPFMVYSPYFKSLVIFLSPKNPIKININALPARIPSLIPAGNKNIISVMVIMQMITDSTNPQILFLSSPIAPISLITP